MKETIIRYTVRPTGAIRGWLVQGITDANQWAPRAYAKCNTKREAEALKDTLNNGLKAKGVYKSINE